MISERMFNTTVTISRPTHDLQASGGYENDANAAIYTSVPCSLQPETSSLIVEENQRRGLQSATIFMRPVTPGGAAISINEKDVASVGGVSWRVVGPSIDASAGRGELIRIPVEAPLFT